MAWIKPKDWNLTSLSHPQRLLSTVLLGVVSVLAFRYSIYITAGIVVVLVLGSTWLGRLWERHGPHSPSQRRLLEAADRMENSRKRFILLVRALKDGIWEWDKRYPSVYFSPRWKSMLGYRKNELGDTLQAWFSRVHPDDLEPLREGVEQLSDGTIERLEVEYRIYHRDGSYRWARTLAVGETGSHGDVVRILGSQADITSHKATETQLRHDAFHDPLTGLANRALLNKRLDKALDRIRRDDSTHFAVFFLDVDDLKIVNDTQGHDAGDRLLEETAMRLQACVGVKDVVARVGGDEFAILAEKVTSPSQAVRLAQRIRYELQNPNKPSKLLSGLGASIGIALSSIGYESSEDMLRDADLAMYRAKIAGKGSYQIFDEEMHRLSLEKIELEKRLGEALERGEFALCYRPILDLKSARVIGFEALPRWQHPSKGMLLPERFLGGSGEGGLTPFLTWWALEQACRQIGEWGDLISPDRELTIGLNFDSDLFSEMHLISRLREVVQRTKISPDRLCLEISSSRPIDRELEVIMSDIRRMGLGLRLDRFGKGFLSLDRLRHLPIQALKIDSALVRKVGESRQETAIVESIVRFGKALAMPAIATGVEHTAQVVLLRELGCELAQGDALGGILGCTEAEAYLKDMRRRPSDSPAPRIIAAS